MAVPAPKAAPVKKPRRSIKAKRRDRTQELSALYATFATLVSSDPAEVLQSAVEQLRSATAADAAIIRILDLKTETFTHIAQVGFSPAALRARRQLNDSSDVSAALRSGEPMIVADIAADARLKGKKQLSEGYRSCAFLPIMVAGKLRGLIHLVSRVPRRFSEAEKENLTAIARQMGAALENRELFEQTQKLAAEIETRYGELQRLHELSQAVLSSPDMPSTLSAALQKVLASPRLDVANIRLFDGSGRLEHSAHVGYLDTRNTTPHHFDSNNSANAIFVPRVMASRQSVVVSDIGSVEGLRTFKREGVRSAIVVPIATDSETLGVIEVGSRTPRAFRAEEVRLLEAMGAQLGVAVQKARLFERIRTSAQEQAALSAVAAAASRSLETGPMLGEALAKVLEITGRKRGSIRIKDPITGKVELAAQRGFSPDEVEEIVRRTPSQMIEEVFATGKAVVIDDASLREAARPLVDNVRSVAWIPIMGRESVMGVLAVSGERPRPFEARELDFLKAIGQVIGVALQNSWLYVESQRQKEVQQLLKELSQDITALDLPALLKKITEKVRQFVKVDISDIRVLENGGMRRLVGASGVDESHLYQLGGIRGRTTWIVEHRRPLVIPDTAKDSLPTGQGLRRLGVRGYAAIPLFSPSGEVIGILRALSYEPREFLASEIDLLQQLANGAAIAIQNARLFAETQQRQEEQAAINAIAMATTESLHVNELLKIALAKVLEVTGRSRGSIKLKEPVTGKIVLAAHQGISANYADTIRSHLAPEETAAHIFESGEVVVVNDPEKNLFNLADREAGLRSLLWVPLKARGAVIGILNVSTPQTEPFSAREIELLKSIGHVIGIAVENARLFEETERRGREQTALHAVTAAVGGSFELDQTLAQALDTVLEATGMDGGYIYLLDAERGRIMLKAHRGMSDAFIARMENQREAGAKTAQIVATKEPLTLEDIPADHQGRFKGEHVTAAACIPIVAKNTVVGVLAVCTKNRPTFPKVQLPLLSSIGNALGVALENARLFRETDRHLKRLQALREIDQAISSTLDLENVLKILLEKIDVTLPYASATIRLIDRRTGLLEPVACRNLDDVEWKKNRGGRGIPNVVFSTQAPVVIRDVRADARASDLEFYHKHKLVSYVGVPLIVNQEIIGVLGFYTKEEHEFEIEEINFLATLAGQAAIAIQNSQLYEEARLREQQLEDGNRMLSALHAAAAAASQSLDLNRVLKAVIEKITEIFGFDTTRVHIYDPGRGELVLRGYFESDAEAASERSFGLGQGIVGRVAASGKSMIFEDIQTDPRYHELSHSKRGGRRGRRFFGVFPIRGKLHNLGTLACTGIAARHLTPSEIRLIEALTDHLAVAIENSQLYDELKQKVAELERANKVKDEFLSVMSHELRTPLNVVIGYAGLLREGMLGMTSPEQNKALDKLVGRTSDLLSMITSILYAASIDANEVRVEKDQFALGEFLDDVKRGYVGRLGKPVELKWDYAADLPVVFSDRDKVKCIVQNLIGNAIKFTNAGSVTVSARAVQAERSEQVRTGNALAAAVWMEFKVSDTGIGIAEEKLPIIFDKFCQADSSETRQYGGVGLGLYIAKSFAELLGGNITVETALGRGSTFTVKLPCRNTFDLTTIEVSGADPTRRPEASPEENDNWMKA